MEFSTGRSTLNPYIAVVVGLLAMALYVATTKKAPKARVPVPAAATATTAAPSTVSPYATAAPSLVTPQYPTTVSQYPTEYPTVATQPGTPAAPPSYATHPPLASVGPMVAPPDVGYPPSAGYPPAQAGGAAGDPVATGVTPVPEDDDDDGWFGDGAAATAATTAAVAATAGESVGESVGWTLISIFVGIIVFFGLLAVLGRLGGVDITAALNRSLGTPSALYDVTLSHPGPEPEAPMPTAPVSQGEVFQVGRGNLTYVEAQAACKMNKAELATYAQVEDAYNSGAEWCSYGWSDGQLALFPTQQATYEKLQAGCTGAQNSCGRPGVNGGFIANPNVRMGANCYGVKPRPTPAERRATRNPSTSPQASEAAALARLFKQADRHFQVKPFAPGEWSETAGVGSSAAADGSVPPDMQATL